MLTTTSEMYDYVLVGLDKAAAATIDPEDFVVSINGSMLDWVKQRYQLYDKSEQARNDLRVITPPPAVITNTGGTTPGTEQFILPYTQSPAAGSGHGFMFALNVGLRLTVNGAPAPCSPPGGWVHARPLTRDSRYSVLNDPFTSPTDDEPYYDYQEGVIRTYTGGALTADVRVEYLRYPVALSLVPLVNPELPSHVNQEICDMCIRKTLETLESRRWQTNVNETKLKSS